jgi:hypothetical protein
MVFTYVPSCDQISVLEGILFYGPLSDNILCYSLGIGGSKSGQHRHIQNTVIVLGLEFDYNTNSSWPCRISTFLVQDVFMFQCYQFFMYLVNHIVETKATKRNIPPTAGEQNTWNNCRNSTVART